MTAPTETVYRAEIAKRVGMLAAAYAYVKISKETLKVYVGMLSDLSLEVLDIALQQCVAESEFFPTVAKIRDVALSLTSSTSVLRSAWEAWEEVRCEISRVGYYRRPQFSNEAVMRAVNMIGWSQLCLSENQVADRAHFTRVYEQLVERQKQKEGLLPQATHLLQVSRTASQEGNVELLRSNDRH
jgi:hypothetical protein